MLAAGGCERAEPGERVVLYSSADGYLLREVVADFEDATGIRVDVVGDTEATKTTGLVERLLAEREAPRADVWWSSEPYQTVRLADAGVLAPYTSAPNEAELDPWPAGLRDAEGRWYGFASRARVIAYASDRLDAADVPRRIADLTADAWRGRVGMARPEFGTTRGHVAAILAADRPEVLERWLASMRANGMRIYDGNATVVAAIARGEIDVGLTDTDDVYAAQRNGWRVDFVFEAADDPLTDPLPPTSRGPLLMPNTVGLVAGGPNPDAAGRLIDYLLSERASRVIAASDSRNFPVRPELRAELGLELPAEAWTIDPAIVARAMPEAMEVCDRALAP
ncbi:MAG: extracellular solute-binding protein [Planctomycetota bacterium]